MTLTLNLTPELESRLRKEAKQKGLPADEYAAQVLDEHVLPTDDKKARKELVALVQSWIDDPDPKEQIETREFLVKALDEDRTSGRKLFPPELKGISW